MEATNCAVVDPARTNPRLRGRLVGSLVREGENPGLSHEVDFKDRSDSSSIDASVVDEGEDDRDSVASDQEGETEFGDPDEYGERLVDLEVAEEEVDAAAHFLGSSLVGEGGWGW